MKNKTRSLLCVVMDGVGARKSRFGNAVSLARTPAMDFLKAQGLYTTLKAHGTYVGLPSNNDIGNSEVGHNALGAGRIFDQGAKLVEQALNSEKIFQGKTWQQMMLHVKEKNTLHFLGLLSDGNVHSHETHLHKMLKRAHAEGIKKIRVHVLLDGRDVAEKSAEKYSTKLETILSELRALGVDAQVASGGGRMMITMDRYNAEWGMVEKGWKTHVMGEGEGFYSLSQALATFRKNPDLVDQYLPPFVIKDSQGSPVGTIKDGDGVILFNFRGDRAIEISRAFEEESFSEFDRIRFPKIFFAGMMEYDGDLHIPKNFLVSPPEISHPLGEYMADLKIKQFACSETQKYGHVTYFWNGNRSNYFNKKLEEYLEIPSDVIPFHLKPWMKAFEITEETIKRLHAKAFDFGRINFANGDMVGHSGDLEAAIIAVATVDASLGRLIKACKETKTILMVTADHGNCDEMFDAQEKDFPDWESLSLFTKRPTPKTSHTLSEVPLYIYDPLSHLNSRSWRKSDDRTLGHMANTMLDAMGLPINPIYYPSLLE